MTGPSASVPLGDERVLGVHLDHDVVILAVPTEWEVGCCAR
ncbi:MAG TPA: hypothetical protein VFK32_07160 [Tepidiformaceae bacterium]|nr:hypothetical protein [Tepidiformaceae bacterium]